MILKFGARNFGSFKEGFEVNFTFDGKTPENVTSGDSVSRVIGIKGANGSGKTAILKAFEFITSFAARSSDSKKDDDIWMLDSFYHNEAPSDFFMEFIVDNITYLYELRLTRKEVLKETLSRKVARQTILIERVGNSFKSIIKELEQLKMMKLRSNASFISLFSKLNFDNMSFLEDIHMHFYKVLTNVRVFGLVTDFEMSVDEVSKTYASEEGANTFDFIKKIIQKADAGIKDIYIQKSKDDDGEERSYPVFIHKLDNEEDSILLYQDESSGTKKLFRQLAYYALVLETGGILSIDEFDTHLHALILPELINLFLNEKSNPLNAQLIFTAHNTEIIDKLGKYRTVLVNKENNESYSYRLDELPSDLVRNDRSIVPLYLKGKIGGVPM